MFKKIKKVKKKIHEFILVFSLSHRNNTDKPVHLEMQKLFFHS